MLKALLEVTLLKKSETSKRFAVSILCVSCGFCAFCAFCAFYLRILYVLSAHSVCAFFVRLHTLFLRILWILYVLSTHSMRSFCSFYAFFLRILCAHSVRSIARSIARSVCAFSVHILYYGYRPNYCTPPWSKFLTKRSL